MFWQDSRAARPSGSHLLAEAGLAGRGPGDHAGDQPPSRGAASQPGGPRPERAGAGSARMWSCGNCSGRCGGGGGGCRERPGQRLPRLRSFPTNVKKCTHAGNEKTSAGQRERHGGGVGAMCLGAGAEPGVGVFVLVLPNLSPPSCHLPWPLCPGVQAMDIRGQHQSVCCALCVLDPALTELCPAPPSYAGSPGTESCPHG